MRRSCPALRCPAGLVITYAPFMPMGAWLPTDFDPRALCRYKGLYIELLADVTEVTFRAVFKRLVDHYLCAFLTDPDDLEDGGTGEREQAEATRIFINTHLTNELVRMPFVMFAGVCLDYSAGLEPPQCSSMVYRPSRTIPGPSA